MTFHLVLTICFIQAALKQLKIDSESQKIELATLKAQKRLKNSINNHANAGSRRSSIVGKPRLKPDADTPPSTPKGRPENALYRQGYGYCMSNMVMTTLRS